LSEQAEAKRIFGVKEVAIGWVTEDEVFQLDTSLYVETMRILAKLVTFTS